MNEIDLKFNNGFEWVISKNITLKGYLFDGEGRFLTADEAINLFHNVEDMASLEGLLKQVDGIFTVIIALPQGTLIATDPIGTFPLLYVKEDAGWFIADDTGAFAAREKKWIYNREVQPEFLSAGFVLGDDTLINEIKRTQAGEILFLHQNQKKEQKTYYWFLPRQFTSQSESTLKQELKDVLQSVANRLIDSLQGKTAVVPLSGGYDSRLIACMLKKAGYEKVICFTYGKPNKESEISKKVAEALGFKWFFIDYDDIDIQGLTTDPIFLDYCNYVGNISSMPYLQEYFALKHLKEHRLIPENSIFIPGHIGDNIAGSFVEKTIRVTGNQACNNSRDIRNGYFNFLPLSSEQKKMIETRLEDWFLKYSPPEFVADSQYDVTTEDWALKERLSKFIFNSSGVFSFFGYQYRFPLFDEAFRSFFRKLPFSFRKHKVLYNLVLKEDYFITSGVYFPGEEINERPITLRFKKIKGNMKFLVPYSLKKMRLRKHDYICYHKFTRELLKDLEARGITPPERINNYNALICFWYSNQTMQRFTDIDKI